MTFREILTSENSILFEILPEENTLKKDNFYIHSRKFSDDKTLCVFYTLEDGGFPFFTISNLEISEILSVFEAIDKDFHAGFTILETYEDHNFEIRVRNDHNCKRILLETKASFINEVANIPQESFNFHRFQLKDVILCLNKVVDKFN